MYESHFGLKSRPFGRKAEGDAMFVGPGQVELINGLQKGLLAQDAVVAVSGPVGCGKTTVVNRGLETMSPGRVAAWVGRMKISSEEILELLLAGFGFNRITNSTLQRFAAFRRFMNERAAAGVPVAIVVEDARKLGAAALAEIEALTASDTADGGGANIILMGDEGLGELLADPELARLKQRIRRRLQVRPLSDRETTGYLKHTIRVGGGEYDALFEPGVAAIVHACSEGMPRMINSLCDSALAAAMDAGDNRVSTRLMHEVATHNFGFDGPAPPADVEAAAPDPSIESNPKPAAELPMEAPVKVQAELPVETQQMPKPEEFVSIPGIREEEIPESARNLVVESGRYPEEPPALEDNPAAAEVEHISPLTDNAEQTQDFVSILDDEPTLTDIPDLINDTQPQLDALSDAVGELLAAGRASERVAAEAGADGDEETFDLDATLSPDVESTNLMPGITPNLDELVASEAAEPEPTPAPAIDLDDLPTLSDSMRVDLKQETEKAERPGADSAEDAAAPEPAVTEAVVSTTAESEKEGPAAETDFGDALDSLLEANREADTALNANDTGAAAGPGTGDESPVDPAAEPSLEQEPEPSPELEPALEPDLQMLVEAEAPSEPGAKGAPDTPAEPTLEDCPDNAPLMHDPAEHGADLASDLDALEAALQAAKSGELGALTMSAAESSSAANDDALSAPDTPEITIDDALAEQQTQTRKLEEFTAALDGVNSMEDVDDHMAETLFGEELPAVADSVTAEGQLLGPNGKHSPELSDDISEAEVAASNDGAAGHEEAPVANGRTFQPRIPSGDDELRDSVTLRIEALNRMKAKLASEQAETVELGEAMGRKQAPRPKGPQPEPIERQINTSMTRTLEALNVPKKADENAEQKARKKPGSLFAKFRRSS